MSFDMNRRRWLALAGSALTVGVAGCSGNSQEAAGGDTPVENPGGDAGSSATATDASTETETDTTTETPTEPPGEAEVVITSREVQTMTSQFDTEEAVAVFELVNEGDAPSGPVNVDLRFYDDTETILSTRPATARTLGPGETWRGFKQFLGDDPSEVVAVRLEAEYVASLSVLDNVDVVESSLEKGDGSYITSTGVLENNTGAELGYIEAISKFYIEENVIAGSEYTNELNIPEGERWRFENMFDASFTPEITTADVIPGDN